MSSVTFYKSEARKGESASLLILAHGAGAPADSPWMDSLVSALSLEGVTTLRFEFPYMEKRRQDGRKRPPDRQPVLLQHFREAVAAATGAGEGAGIFVGGKSMGGRMASLMLAQADFHPEIRGAVGFGYPFHAPGKPDIWRTGHFSDLERPLLIIQGTRDPFGRKVEVEERRVGRAGNVDIAWLEGGDHDFRPLARQPESHDQMIRQAARLAAAFMFSRK